MLKATAFLIVVLAIFVSPVSAAYVIPDEFQTDEPDLIKYTTLYIYMVSIEHEHEDWAKINLREMVHNEKYHNLEEMVKKMNFYRELVARQGYPVFEDL